MALQVTASATNDTFGGGYLQVEVLTGAALAATPAIASSTTSYSVNITTTQTGSFVLGTLENQDASTTFVAATGCTILSQASINAGGAQGGGFRTTSATGTPGSTAVGSSTAFPLSYGVVALEVIPVGSIAFDASTPAAVTSASATSFTTASFNPPAGAVLVALFASSGNSGGGTCVGTVSGGGLTWTEQVKVNSVVEFNGYIGIWTATVPAAAGPQAQAYRGGQAWRAQKRRRTQVLLTPPDVIVVPSQVTPEPVVVVAPNASQWFNTPETIISVAPNIPPPVQSIQPPPVVQAEPYAWQWFASNSPIAIRSSLQDVPPAIQPDVTAAQPALVWYEGNPAVILRNTLQDPPQLTTPPPVVVTQQPTPAWFEGNPTQTFRSSLQDVVAPTAATPGPIVVTSQPDRSYGRGGAEVVRSSLQDFGTPSPIVVTSQPASAWLKSNPVQPTRSTLQDPPVLTTPQPVVVSAPTDARWLKTQAPQVVQPVPTIPPPTTGPTTNPVVVTSQSRSDWFKVQGPQDFRNTTQDPPVLTTPDPIIVSAPTPQALLRPNLPQVLRNPQAPVVTPATTPSPVVVSSTGVRVGTGGQVIFRRGSVFVQTWRDPICFGGSAVDANHLGGTVTGNRFAGTVTGNRFGGTVIGNRFAGSASPVHTLAGSGTVQRTFSGSAMLVDPWGGSVTEWCMQEVDINLGEFNDETLAVAITNNGSAYDLTGKQLQALFKTAAGVADSDPSTITLSSPSSGITITNAVGGLANIAIPRADLANANITFWRCDVVASGLQNTAIYGKVAVTLL